jgi:hypothetical protein
MTEREDEAEMRVLFSEKGQKPPAAATYMEVLSLYESVSYVSTVPQEEQLLIMIQAGRELRVETMPKYKTSDWYGGVA